MNLVGTIPAIVAALVAIVAAVIAYNSYRLAQHYRDPIWVIDFDRQLDAEHQRYTKDAGAEFPLVLRLNNHGPDTAKDVTVRATWDPTDMQRVSHEWVYVEGNGSRTWKIETMLIPMSSIVYSDWDARLDNDERRRTFRVEWKGPQSRRRHADVPLPTMGPLMSYDQKWWELSDNTEAP